MILIEVLVNADATNKEVVKLDSKLEPSTI